MGNTFQKLGLVLQNRNTNVLIMAVFIFANLTLVGVTFGLLTNKEAISILYTLVIVLVLHAIDRSVQDTLRKRLIPPPKLKFTGILRPVKEYSDFQVEIETSNKYIDRWKKLNLNQSPNFPLERLAFLNATIFDCQKKHFFYLRNSQVKDLAVRKVSPKHCDDVCHPKKLVTDLFGSYIHRRSLFYRNRNVSAVNKRQFTKSFYPTRNDRDSVAHSILYGKETKKKFEKIIQDDDINSGRSSVEKGPKKYIKSMKRAVGSAVEGLIPESLRKSKKSDKDEKVKKLTFS